jgi:hypothetical protein
VHVEACRIGNDFGVPATAVHKPVDIAEVMPATLTRAALPVPGLRGNEQCFDLTDPLV